MNQGLFETWTDWVDNSIAFIKHAFFLKFTYNLLYWDSVKKLWLNLTSRSTFKKKIRHTTSRPPLLNWKPLWCMCDWGLTLNTEDNEKKNFSCNNTYWTNSQLLKKNCNFSVIRKNQIELRPYTYVCYLYMYNQF